MSAMSPLGRLPLRARRVGLVLLALLIAGGLRATDANPAFAQTVALRAFQVAENPGLDAAADIWRKAPSVEVPLTGQMVTYPTGGGLGIDAPTVQVRALHNGDTLFIALEWPDRTVDDSTASVDAFADAAAVQFPGEPTSTVPSVCMGQADQSVNIWHWRADSQAGVPDTPESGYVDLYPSTDDLQYPARVAGNPYARPDAGAVQNLVAGGFGTLSPGDGQVVMGEGTHDRDRWRVVFARDYQAPGSLQPTFADGQVIDIAFAVWDGALQERNGMKSVTSFVKLDLTSEGVPDDSAIVLASVIGMLLLIGGIATVAGLLRRRSRVAGGTD